jgi:hypothetical protein
MPLSIAQPAREKMHAQMAVISKGDEIRITCFMVRRRCWIKSIKKNDLVYCSLKELTGRWSMVWSCILGEMAGVILLSSPRKRSQSPDRNGHLPIVVSKKSTGGHSREDSKYAVSGQLLSALVAKNMS